MANLTADQCIVHGDSYLIKSDAMHALLDRAAFPKTRSDPATWVLHLLASGEISVGKASEWLREYIRDGKKGPLPKIEALP